MKHHDKQLTKKLVLILITDLIVAYSDIAEGMLKTLLFILAFALIGLAWGLR